MRGLRILAAFWACIPVEVTLEASIVPRFRYGAIGTPFQLPHMARHAEIRNELASKN